jgi:hypothetical protein
VKTYVARLAVVAVVLVAGGCGGGSGSSSTTAQASTFRSDFKLAIAQFKLTSHAIGVAIEHASGKSDSQIGTEFSALASQWQADVNRLAPLTPPAAVAGQFTTLKDAATRTEGDLMAIVAAAHTHSGNAAKQAGASLVRDILAAKAASQVVSKKLGIS